MNKRELLRRALTNPGGLRFDELVELVEAFGFQLSRTRGSHHIFAHPDVRELVNLQRAGGMAKPYQVRQFLRLTEKYNLPLEPEP